MFCPLHRGCPSWLLSLSKYDHVLLGEVHLSKGSILVFDRGYVDYTQYERFTQEGFFYITRLKDNALYECGEEYDIPEDADGY